MSRIPHHNRPVRLAVVGVGNTFRGDDGVGVFLVRELSQHFSEFPNVMFLEAGTAPENVTGQLQRFQPDFILFVDAAQMEEVPGAIGIWSYDQCGGDAVSTHTLPLSVVCAYLDFELECEIAILGIQPAVLDCQDDLSPQIKKTLEESVPSLAAALRQVICLASHGSEPPSEFVGENPFEVLTETFCHLSEKEVKAYDRENSS